MQKKRESRKQNPVESGYGGMEVGQEGTKGEMWIGLVSIEVLNCRAMFYIPHKAGEQRRDISVLL